MTCKQIDSFFDGQTFIVQVELSNGEIVFLDDGRPGFEPASAWLRLKTYCDTQNLRVKNINAICEQGKVLLVQTVDREDTKTGVFLINRVAWLNGVNLEMLNVGLVDGNKIRVTSYVKKPLSIFEVSERPLVGNEWLVI